MLSDIMPSSHHNCLQFLLFQFWLNFDQIYFQSGKGRGRPKKNAEPEVNKEIAMMTKIPKMMTQTMTKMMTKMTKIKYDDKDDDKEDASF